MNEPLPVGLVDGFYKAFMEENNSQTHLPPSKRQRCSNDHKNRDYGLQYMSNLSDFDFERMFRLSRKSFQKLVGMVGPFISRDVKKAKNSSGSGISNVTRLAATLRYLAGGSHYDICAVFGLDSKNFFNKYYVLWTTIAGIDAALSLGFSFEADDLRRTADGFSRYSNGVLSDCVMAIDGWVCVTRQPSKKEVGNSTLAYRNRKSCFGLVVLAGCDANAKFTMVSTMDNSRSGQQSNETKDDNN